MAARRNTKFRILAFLVIMVPLFTLVTVFGFEWRYIEKISREDLNERDRTPDNARKRTVLSPNNRSPLDTYDEVENVVDVPRMAAGGFAERKDSDVLESIVVHLQKQAPLNLSTSVLDSLSKQAPLSLKDEARFYELLRERKVQELRVEKSMRELWWYIRDRVAKIDRGTKVARETIASAKEQYFVMRSHFDELKHIGGGDGTVDSGPTQVNWEYWQRNMSQEMTKLMERRLNYLQNPPNCVTAKKLICEVAKTCGFGCQIHHVAYCFIMAYATKRTLILDSNRWRYSTDGWSAVFQPVSSTCTSASGKSSREYCTLSVHLGVRNKSGVKCRNVDNWIDAIHIIIL